MWNQDEDQIPANIIHDEAKKRHGKYYRTPGYYLRLYRQRANLTQVMLADQSSITPRCLPEVENNKRALDEIDAKKLADILDCDYRRLL